MQWGLPVHVSVEPTSFCNLRCPECPTGLRALHRPSGFIDMDTYRRIIDELARHAIFLTLYFQGEPYLHPQFEELVEYAVGRGLYVTTSTNGHYLTEERAVRTVRSGLHRLIVSIDGITQETYSAYRVGGSLERVIKGVRRLRQARERLGSRTPVLVWQFLVVKPNEHEVERARLLAKKWGFDRFQVKTAQIYDYKNGNPLIPTVDRYSRYRRLPDGTYTIKNPLHNQCWRLWTGCVITWDGRVVPCCFDKDARYQMGNIAEKPLAEIWHNGHYSHFRRQILKGRKHIDICTNCSEGTRIWA